MSFLFGNRILGAYYLDCSVSSGVQTAFTDTLRLRHCDDDSTAYFTSSGNTAAGVTYSQSAIYNDNDNASNSQEECDELLCSSSSIMKVPIIYKLIIIMRCFDIIANSLSNNTVGKFNRD